MKIIRFLSSGSIRFGQWLDDRQALAIEGDLFGLHQVSDRRLPIDKLLCPLVPVDILCIGLNYKEHAAESASQVPKNPMLFIKASNTLNNPLDPILVPRLSKEIDYEAELVVVIGKTARHVPRERALDYVFGYTCANDVSARDWQRDKDLGGGQFARGKSFDGFCPLGPWIVTSDEVPDPSRLRVRSILNGKVMQDAPTSDMMYDLPALIASLSSTMTLKPGTVILTGTPPGVGFARTPPVWLRPGDRIVVDIEGIGRLENPVGEEG